MHRRAQSVAWLVLCSVFLATASTAVAQGETQQQAFRSWAVSAMHWQPDQDVGLTTTEYAKKYLQRYDDRVLGKFANQPNQLVTLFQTESLDIILYTDRAPDISQLLTALHPKEFAVVERATGEVVSGGQFYRDGGMMQNARFVDAVGGNPPELQIYQSGQVASGFGATSFFVYDIGGERSQEIFRLTLETRDQKCPALQWRAAKPGDVDSPVTEAGMKGSETVAGQKMTFYLEPVLTMGSSEQCRAVAKAPLVERTCTYSNVKAKYECVDTPVHTAGFRSLSLLKSGETWQENATNIRWFLGHLDQLRKVGYRIPKEFVEQLSRHLPDQ